VKYVQPYGISDPNAPYINGDPSIARQGSIPPAAAFEHPMRELVNVITKSGITPSSSDLAQVAEGIRSQFMNYCVDTGSVNTLSVALDPPIGAYTFGLPLHVMVHNTNTGAVTIDAGAGRVPVRKPNGTDLAAGDLPAFGLAALVYDGTVFQMINFGGAGGGPITINQTIPYCVDSSTSRNLVTANFTPAITTLVAGTIFMVKIANTSNSSQAYINVNGLGNKPIYAQGCNANWPCLPGDIQVGDVLVFTYDGTRFWVYANPAINETATLYCSTVAQIRDLFSALGRKRISTSGFLQIILAAGYYKPPYDDDLNIVTTYHPDANRINLIGTMNAGQSPPPNANVFSRSGNDPVHRSNDAMYNKSMLESRYATIFQLDSNPGAAIGSKGGGAINIQNILVEGPNFSVIGQVGFSARANMYCIGCTAWGVGDIGFMAYGPAHLSCAVCHACACASRGFGATGSAQLDFQGGSSEGNASHGIEISHGARCTSDFTESLTLDQGLYSTHNGGCGLSAQSGFGMLWWATLNTNGGPADMYAWNMGTIAERHCSIGTVSPAWGAEGNLNSISINYG